MSQSAAVPPPELRASLQVSSVTLLVLVLLPCVVLLLLLHCCLLLGYKLLLLARRKRARYTSESVLLRSSSSSLLSTRQRIARNFTDGPVRKTRPASVSEPMMAAPPITSSRTSSVERGAACGQRCRSEARAAGRGYLCGLRVAPGAEHGAVRQRVARLAKECPVLLQSSDSDMERENVAPPNSPEQLVTQSRHGSLPVMMRRTSSVELELVSLDKVHMEGELVSSIPQETSCFIASASSSAAGPGLDSDFGASAGVSLRILSADSDGFQGQHGRLVLNGIITTLVTSRRTTFPNTDTTHHPSQPNSTGSDMHRSPGCS